eukprot:GFYU01003100.1.p1 GENE.GFYU01003100.1~~GFYU01003100.1.p1  ORF type:complete len:292 (+),score=80.40 GFYU01003100.1:130-1005(+)
MAFATALRTFSTSTFRRGLSTHATSQGVATTMRRSVTAPVAMSSRNAPALTAAVFSHNTRAMTFSTAVPKTRDDHHNSGGSGYATYDDAHDAKYGEPHPVKCVVGTAENLKGYANIVYDYDKEDVIIERWPQLGSRPIMAGTGRDGGVTEGLFRFEWSGDLCEAKNDAVGGDYITGRLPEGANPKDRQAVLVRELNYHPDGGQVVYPTNGEAFVALLGLPGDEVTLDSFVAFYCDGSFGIQILPDVWHQPVYPIPDSAVYQGKQGKVHACVGVDTVNEFNKWLLVPLSPNA